MCDFNAYVTILRLDKTYINHQHCSINHDVFIFSCIPFPVHDHCQDIVLSNPGCYSKLWKQITKTYTKKNTT